MLNISFLEVGQGDSIIIQWKDDENIDKIGIIDCNLKPGNINPTIEFLKIRNYKKIEFLILTHPHTDHFSGFLSLLDFCERENIKVDIFYHTGHYNREYIKSVCEYDENFILSSVNGNINCIGSPKHKLYSLYLKLDELHQDKKSFLKKVTLVADNTAPIRLNNKFELSFLSPGYYDEINLYLKKVANKEKDFYIIENNPDANLLSTVISISSKDSYVLITSDVVKNTLMRIENEWFCNNSKKIMMTDVPHHGSLNSHIEQFWSNRKNGDKIPAIFSVGEGYNHPDKEVVEYFNNHYKVYTTNFVGGFPKYFNKDSAPRHKLSLLEIIDDSQEKPVFDDFVATLMVEWKEDVGCFVK